MKMPLVDGRSCFGLAYPLPVFEHHIMAFDLPGFQLHYPPDIVTLAVILEPIDV